MESVENLDFMSMDILDKVQGAHSDWTMSMDSVDIVQSPSTLSLDSMDNVHGLSGKSGHCPLIPRVIVYRYFVDFECPIVHAKFQDHGTPGSEEEDF